jgi:hypothetical protein
MPREGPVPSWRISMLSKILVGIFDETAEGLKMTAGSMRSFVKASTNIG